MPMPRLRHLAAVLMGVLALQVTLLGSRVVCPQAPVSDVAPTHASAPGHRGGHEHGSPTDDADRADEQSHDGLPTHCLSAMSCVVTGLAGCGASLCAEERAPTTEIAIVDDALPASLGGAPEPPPPRG